MATVTVAQVSMLCRHAIGSLTHGSETSWRCAAFIIHVGTAIAALLEQEAFKSTVIKYLLLLYVCHYDNS